ncbi:putative CTP-dependent riboflavin kinase [Desulfosarcina cetonica]|uniref:DUF120 domain-containing protein n=1 Tax=Desulfosarcina cetonica TaxID=90730 RepID=UPI0006D24F4B|nr:DUF120 domain-containing protein [Desulfosarcina cetonica]VTR64023.1 putative CTP-dependent riboflavin kinase [Desulfosarcina cetonica]
MNKRKKTFETTMTISGSIQSGIGKGGYFTSVDWVVQQCRDKLGYAPFPGTLNIRVRDEDMDKLERFLAKTDAELVPDSSTFCAAPLKKVTIKGVPAAVVLPAENVRVHENRILEIISPRSFKQSFGLKDGDQISVIGKTTLVKKDNG